MPLALARDLQRSSPFGQQAGKTQEETGVSHSVTRDPTPGYTPEIFPGVPEQHNTYSSNTLGLEVGLAQRDRNSQLAVIETRQRFHFPVKGQRSVA